MTQKTDPVKTQKQADQRQFRDYQFNDDSETSCLGMIESGVSEARGELRLFLTGSVHGKNNRRYGHIILQSWR